MSFSTNPGFSSRLSEYLCSNSKNNELLIIHLAAVTGRRNAIACTKPRPLGGYIYRQHSLQQTSMGLFSFLKFFKADKTQKIEFDPNEYVPSFGEDDYCQIEIVPSENRNFIQMQSEQIDDLASNSRTAYGFTETFGRGPMPIRTVSKEIRFDYFEKTLTDFKFQKARHIRYDKSEILNCETGKTKAFGFSNFTIFFDTEDEFVKNIWVDTGLIVSAPQFGLIQDTLYTLGEECEFILIDWNSLRLYDLADRKQIQDYLMWHFK